MRIIDTTRLERTYESDGLPGCMTFDEARSCMVEGSRGISKVWCSGVVENTDLGTKGTGSVEEAARLYEVSIGGCRELVWDQPIIPCLD